jgi:ABC-type transporter Mla subunit MlaD
LSAGSRNVPLLRRGFGGPPPIIQGHGSQIDIILERSEDIVLRASEAMAAVRDLLTDQNIARVTHIIQNLETVSAQLADQRGVIMQSGQAAASITRAANNVASLTAQTQRDLADLQEVMRNLRTATATASGETLPEITRAAEELARASDAVESVARNIEDNPSVLTPRSPRPTVELPR